MIIDRQCVQQVLGCLMKNPRYFSQVDKYSFVLTDFPTRFEKYIYSAIYGLYTNGATVISPIDIENYLSSDATAKKTFELQNGIEYLQDIEDFTNAENFDYYYNKLKKLNLLKDLQKQGIDISDFYVEDLASPAADEINKKFETLTNQDIISAVKAKLLKIETNYVKTDSIQIESMSDDIDSFVSSLEETCEIGVPVQGSIYNQIISGAQKGTLTIRSGSSGLGKAIPMNSFLPTPNGWREAKNIKKGDFLFDGFGNPTKVLGVFPQGKKRTYLITFADGRVCRCCDEHLWSFCTIDQKNEYKLNRIFYTKTLKDILAEGLYDENGTPKILIPMQKPVKYSKKHHDISIKELAKKIAQGEKIILTRDFIEDSIKNRILFLRELFSRAGIVGEDGSLSYIGNWLLVNRITEICRSLGFKTKEESISKTEIKLTVSGAQKEICKLVRGKKKDLLKEKTKNQNDMDFLFNAIVKVEKLICEEEMVCFYVDNKEHLFLCDSFVVTHNTRNAIADAAFLAYPLRYNSSTCQWEQKGSSEKVFFIITEQSFKEVKKMVLAYLTDINEARFKRGHFSEREKEVISQAKKIVKRYESNLIFAKIPDPNIETVKAIIRENCLTNDISVVFYDYIFISPALLKEFRGFALRNDELLLLMTTALKDLAVELNVCMMTSTQVNANSDNSKEIRNEASLAGGRSTINKADNGAIMARPTKEELEILQPLTQNYGVPNLVTDIFKVRSGEWTQVRIWSVVDLGRMKREDLFLTNSRLEAIEGFFDQENIEVHNWADGEEEDVKALIEEFNNK